MLAQGVEVGGGGAKLRIGESHFSTPGIICKFENGMGDGAGRKAVGIINQATGPITKKRQAIALTECVLSGQLARAHFFIAPEQIALPVVGLGEASIGKNDR